MGNGLEVTPEQLLAKIGSLTLQVEYWQARAEQAESQLAANAVTAAEQAVKREA